MIGDLEIIKRVRVKNKAGKVTAMCEADAQGFLDLSGGLLGCGRCGAAVVREFSGNHFKVCRHYFNLLRESRIVIPGES